MSKIIIPIILGLLICNIQAFFCTQPQRGGSFTFEALSNRDHLTSVFGEINKQVASFNVSVKVDGTDYGFQNFKPQFYYNDNNQVEQYIDDFTVKVTCGQLIMGYNFNVTYGINNTKATGLGKVLVDDFYFVKKTKITDGYFEWDPTVVVDLTISKLMTIEKLDPKLPDDVISMLQNIMNNHAGQQNRLKINILSELNNLYKVLLKNFLNSEKVFNTNNVQYNWKGNMVNYTNQVYIYSLSNIGFKGLKYLYMFELEGYADKCNVLPTEPDPAYGGVQELVGVQFMKAGVLYGLTKGWFNTVLDSKWDTEIFQFYAGDLANVMSGAKKFAPNTPIKGQCHWDNSVFNLTMSYMNKNSISFVIPYACTLKNGDTLLQTLTFNASFVIDLILANDYLDTKISYSGIIGLQFIKSGEFQVEDTVIGAYYVLKVLRSLEGQRTYGAGFPTLFRKFPLLQVTREYIIFYDPSEI